MGSKAFAATALLLMSLNLLFFSLVTSTYCPPVTPKPTPKPDPKPPQTKKPDPKPPQTKLPPKFPPAYPSCPRDTLKLGVCADVLGLVNVVVGSPSTLPCCSLLGGLVDSEAAVCLCTAIKANVLGTNLNVPVSLALLINACGLKCPSDFQCA